MTAGLGWGPSNRGVSRLWWCILDEGVALETCLLTRLLGERTGWNCHADLAMRLSTSYKIFCEYLIAGLPHSGCQIHDGPLNALIFCLKVKYDSIHTCTQGYTQDWLANIFKNELTTWIQSNSFCQWTTGKTRVDRLCSTGLWYRMTSFRESFLTKILIWTSRWEID